MNTPTNEQSNPVVFNTDKCIKVKITAPQVPVMGMLYTGPDNLYVEDHNVCGDYIFGDRVPYIVTGIIVDCTNVLYQNDVMVQMKKIKDDKHVTLLPDAHHYGLTFDRNGEAIITDLGPLSDRYVV